MPSRRRFLATVGATAAAVGVAGCSTAVGDPPAEQWLYDPATALDQRFPWQAYLSVDVPAAWERREQLPEEWVATATSFDQTVESVDMQDLEQVTALGFGTAGLTTMGTTVALTGAIESESLINEFTQGNVAEHDPVAGHRLFSYAPRFLERVTRDGVTAQGTLGLAVGDGAAIAGGLLAPEGTAVNAVEAMVRSGTGGSAGRPHRDLRSAGRALAASPLGSPPVSGVVAFDPGLATRLAEAIPEDWPTLAATVDDLRAIGVGLRFAEDATLTSFVFVYDPRSIAENENLQAAIRKLTDESDTPDSGVVGVRLGPDGRSLVVRTTVSPQAVWTDFRDRLPGF